jgi:Ni/Co efflux regulator RcnB
MKTLIIASMIVFSGAAAVVAPAQAASVIIQSDDGNQYSSDTANIRHRHIDDDNGQYSDTQYEGGQYRRHHHRCHIETVQHWRHHHKVIEQLRVCN